MNKCEPAVQGASGHSTLLSVANALLGFYPDPAVAAAVAWEHYNPRCCPPWNEHDRNDFERKFFEAAKTSTKPAGRFLNENNRSESKTSWNDYHKRQGEAFAPIAEPLDDPNKAGVGSEQKAKPKTIRRPRLIDPNTLEERATDWLWPNKIPLGELSLLAGMAGQGKTFWSCFLTSVITNGWDWPDGSVCPKGSVLFFYGEDSIEKTYKPRLRANGADQVLIRFLDGVEILQEGKEPDEGVFSISCVDDIEAAIQNTETETGQPVRLVVIDPIANYWGDIKENSNAEVRSVLKPLQRLAERTGAAFLLIQHTGKGDKDHAQQRVLGSTGIVASCRSVWGLYPAKTPEGHRYFAPIKTNNCIEPTAVEFVIDRESGGQVQTVNASLEKTGDDIEAEYRTTKQHERQRQGSSSARSVDCCAWLESILLSGEKPYREILEEGTSLDFSESMIKRSRNTIGAISRKQGFGGAAVWSLESPPVQSGQAPENDEKPDSLTLLDEPLRDKDLRQQNSQSGQAIPIYTERDLNGDCTPPTDAPNWSADGPETLLDLPETEAMKEPKRIKI